MAKAEYDWEIGNPAVLEPHSLAKHTILRRYIEEYVSILTSDPRVPELRLTLVDGFAGGGEYLIKGTNEIHEGSPFILMNAVKTAEVLVNQKRKKPMTVDANFILVEKKRSNFLYLENALTRRLDNEARAKVTLINGAFEDHLDTIIHNIKSVRGRQPRPIFVLDQYGYSGVPIGMLSKIMRAFPKPEVFLTLAFDWIGAYARGPEAQALRIQKSLGIVPHLHGFADGSRDMGEVAELPSGDKIATMRYIQQLLHEGFAKQSGATCYTPFFITSRDSNRSYWFLHLAKSPRANDVVKDLHWKVKNRFSHYGGSGLLMLGYDPARAPDDTAQEVFAFDKSAHDQTVEALLEELPRRIRQYPKGISFEALYAAVCNETPASKTILREPIEILCRGRELEKQGAQGEDRAISTSVKDKDLILVPAQKIFSFSGR